MKLYFENAVTTVTTLMILALLGYIGWSVANRAAIQHWGCRSLFLLVFGLAVCCCAAARDGLDKTIQQAIGRQLRAGAVPTGERAYHCRLHRRAGDCDCRHRHAHCQKRSGRARYGSV